MVFDLLVWSLHCCVNNSVIKQGDGIYEVYAYGGYSTECSYQKEGWVHLPTCHHFLSWHFLILKWWEGKQPPCTG